MNIFSEIYGAYYRAVEKLLSFDKFDRQKINEIICGEAFKDSYLFMEQKLIPDKNNISSWGLIKQNDDKTYSKITKNVVPKIMTSLQKSYIKSKLVDKRIKLFLDDEALEELEKRLDKTKKLYEYDDFYYYDLFNDGDDFDSKEYRENFRKILKAVKNHELLKIEFISRKSEALYGMYLPIKLEYSRKNDKFRLYAHRMRNKVFKGFTVLNVGRISKVEETGICFDKTDLQKNHEDILKLTKDKNCVEILVTNERNGIERFMMEFAGFEKRAELDINSGKCHVMLYYDRSDETEILIRLLSYGPVLKVLSPENFKSQVKERVERQYEMLYEGNESE